jgi:hypothetical protein
MPPLGVEQAGGEMAVIDILELDRFHREEPDIQSAAIGRHRLERRLHRRRHVTLLNRPNNSGRRVLVVEDQSGVEVRSALYVGETGCQ